MLVNSMGPVSGDLGFTFQPIAHYSVIVEKLFPKNLSFLTYAMG